MRFGESYIKMFLTEEGRSLSDYVIANDLIMYLSEFNGQVVPMALVIEDDDLLLACLEYLRKTGVREFGSTDAVKTWMKSSKELI